MQASNKTTGTRRGFPLTTLFFCAFVVAIALGIRSMGAVSANPMTWWNALVRPDPTQMADLLLHYSVFPRFVVTLLVGSGLTIAAILFQIVLRNPIADSTTLGISAGAFLALSMANIWAPVFVDASRTLVAALGGLIAGAAVLALAWRSRLSPQTILLSGLLVNLYAGAVNTLLIMYHGGLIQLFIWGSGSLAMQDWSAVTLLLPNVAGVAVAALLFARPLSILTVSDEAARNLGVSPTSLRLICMIIGIWITAVCVSTVGIIGFVGLAAPELVRRYGFSSVKDQLLLAPPLGALLLWDADGLFQMVPTPSEISAGAAMAFVGAPLLLLISARSSHSNQVPAIEGGTKFIGMRGLWWIIILAAALVLASGSLFLGRGFDGWNIGGLSTLDATLHWRGPRLIVAVAAGMMLAISGVIVQRLTANPMASPELLGVTSGSAFAIVMVAIFFPAAPHWVHLCAAALGSFAVLLLMLLFSRKSGFAPDRIFVIGISLATFFSAVITVLLSTGDPRMYGLIGLLSGSTYMATPLDASIAVAAAILALIFVPFFCRWLDMMPLGRDFTRSLGLGSVRPNVTLLVFSSILVAVSVLAAGPLSFVGLIAPHMAKMSGARRTSTQIFAACLFAVALMTISDFVGRVAFVPRQLPVGLVATLIGMPYILWLICSPARA